MIVLGLALPACGWGLQSSRIVVGRGRAWKKIGPAVRLLRQGLGREVMETMKKRKLEQVFFGCKVLKKRKTGTSMKQRAVVAEAVFDGEEGEDRVAQFERVWKEEVEREELMKGFVEVRTEGTRPSVRFDGCGLTWICVDKRRSRCRARWKTCWLEKRRDGRQFFFTAARNTNRSFRKWWRERREDGQKGEKWKDVL